MTILGLFLNDEVRTGGHRRFLSLLEGLAARGHRVVAVLNDQLEFEPVQCEAMRINLPCVRGRVPVSLRFGRAVRRALPAIRKRVRDPDAILVHGETHLLAGVILKNALRTRLVFGHRSNMFREYMARLLEARGSPRPVVLARTGLLKYRLYERAVAAVSNRIVFQSLYDKTDFCSRVRLAEGKSTIINNAFGGPGFEPRFSRINRSQRLRTVVFVGTYGERKGLRYLVEAARILKGRGLDELQFRVFGPGEDRTTYQALVDEQDLGRIVMLEGRTDDALRAIADGDLLIVPSIFDSFPDTVLEALYVGTPVAGSRVGGIPEQLVYDDLLFPARDSPAIASLIEKAVRQPGYYDHLRVLCQARRTAFDFDWPKAWEMALSSAG